MKKLNLKRLDENGYATMALLTLIPLLLATIVLLVGAYLLMKADGIAKHACRVELLKSQERSKEHLEALLAMNAEAQRLRIVQQAAEAVDAASTPPPAWALKLLAKIGKQGLKARQVALATKQKALIAKAKAWSRSSPFHASRTLRARLKAQAEVAGERVAGLRFSSSIQGGAFDVRPEPPGSESPSYFVAHDFTKTQAMQIKWSFDIKGTLPSWLHEFLGEASAEIKGDCSATLVKGQNGWEPKLKTVRL